MTAATNYRVVKPIYQPVRTQVATIEAPPRTQFRPPTPYTSDQLALIQAGVQNVTPYTNPSDLTPDQLNQLQSYQTLQSITAAGGQLSPAQLQSLQAFYQTQAFANSPYVSSSATVVAPSTLSGFISSVPTWAWIAGGIGLIFLLRGRK